MSSLHYIVINQYTQPPTSVFNHPNRCSKLITGTPRKTCLCMKAAIPKGSDTLWPCMNAAMLWEQQTKQMQQQNATLISSHPYVLVWQRSFCNFLKIKKTDLYCGCWCYRIVKMHMRAAFWVWFDPLPGAFIISGLGICCWLDLLLALHEPRITPFLAASHKLLLLSFTKAAPIIKPGR